MTTRCIERIDVLAKEFDAFPMVPCSEFNQVIPLFSLPNAIFCSREEEAIALGAGLCLSGRRPLVMMQSSGLMSSLNTLGSLVVAYALPLTLAVAMRGGKREKNPTQIPVAHAVEDALLAMGCTTIRCSADEMFARFGRHIDLPDARQDAIKPRLLLVSFDDA